MAKPMRCFPAPAGFDPANPPDRVEIDPWDFYEIEDGEPIVIVAPRTGFPDENMAVMAVFHTEVVGFYRETRDPKCAHWAVINGN